MSEEGVSIDEPLTPVDEGPSHTFEELAHYLFSDKHKALHTEMRNPDAMSTLDTAVLGLIKKEYRGTGLYEDSKNWVDWKRRNWIASGRQRAKETTEIASAAAQKETADRNLKEKLWGALER